jgi:hypothetical protein
VPVSSFVSRALGPYFTNALNARCEAARVRANQQDRAATVAVIDTSLLLGGCVQGAAGEPNSAAVVAYNVLHIFLPLSCTYLFISIYSPSFKLLQFSSIWLKL